MVREKCSKLILVSLICLSIMCSYSLVSAKEASSYYTNDNGVSLTKEEYDFLVKMYWDGYPKIMTQKEYQRFSDKKIMEREEYGEKVVTLDDAPFTRGTYHSTAGKYIKIAKSCNTEECFISVVLVWKGVPNVQSYDVMGACLDGDIELIRDPETRVSSSETSFFADDLQITERGFGSSFKLPGGENHTTHQSFDVKKTDNYDYGHIYASYQHARSETTLKVSRNYKIALTGSGRVFDFGDDAYEVYDHMNGVDIEI